MLSAKMVESDEEVSMKPVLDPMSIISLPLQKKHQIFAHKTFASCEPEKGVYVLGTIVANNMKRLI